MIWPGGETCRAFLFIDYPFEERRTFREGTCLASSGRNYIGPSGSNVHAIGWVPSNSRVQVTFSSDFDPVASVTNTQLGSEAPDRVARSSYWADDGGGGNLEPQLSFTTSFSGTLVLHVSKFSAERNAGCYFYKVEIVTP